MSQYTPKRGDGLDDIAAVLAERRIERMPTKIKRKVVRTFGIITGEGKPVTMAFVVTNIRKDPRHGAINPDGGFSKWSKYQLDSMFKGWN